SRATRPPASSSAPRTRPGRRPRPGSDVQRSRLVATRTEVVSEIGVVSGGHLAEAEAGVLLLEQGGNAVDALVAAAFAGFAVEPQMCSVAGYGRVPLHLPGGEFVPVGQPGRAAPAAPADRVAADRRPTRPSY